MASRASNTRWAIPAITAAIAFICANSETLRTFARRIARARVNRNFRFAFSLRRQPRPRAFVSPGEASRAIEERAMKPATLRVFRILRKLGLWRTYRSWRAMALLIVLLTPLPALAYDELFQGGFEAITDAPASDAEAARFLTMATFGPTPSEIAHLRAVGYAQWLAQQLSMPATLQRPYVEALDAGVQNPGQSDRMQIWFANAVTAPDQLRQRMAWALSQIMVVSDGLSHLGQDPIALAEYND